MLVATFKFWTGVLVDFAVVEGTLEDEIQEEAFVFEEVFEELEILPEDLAIEVFVLLAFELVLLDHVATLEDFLELELELTRVDEDALFDGTEVDLEDILLAEDNLVLVVFLGLGCAGHHLFIVVDLAVEVGLELEMPSELAFVMVILMEELDLTVAVALLVELGFTEELDLAIELDLTAELELDFSAELDLTVELL